ncbi:MAG: hypothetical protein JWL71_4 [Acidobacteria bacterium]|nr:hypothetical protein [Acidobacteriota bacterium]
MIASAIAGGVIGTLAMATIMKAASELGMTRMDLALLLGTVVTENRRKARAVGYIMYFVLGVAFAEAYAAFFAIIGHSSWRLGALVGVLHAIFTATVLVSVLLPVVHPRMATADTAANQITLIEPPGFLMLNYGRSTVAVTVVAHLAYGALVGLIVRV